MNEITSHDNGVRFTVMIKKKAKLMTSFACMAYAELVEVGGIEPPSEHRIPKSITCVFNDLI